LKIGLVRRARNAMMRPMRALIGPPTGGFNSEKCRAYCRPLTMPAGSAHLAGFPEHCLEPFWPTIDPSQGEKVPVHNRAGLSRTVMTAAALLLMAAWADAGAWEFRTDKVT
jgi:hypothetical protein